MGFVEDTTKSEHRHNAQTSFTKWRSSKLQQWFLFLHLIQQITPDFEGEKICSNVFKILFTKTCLYRPVFTFMQQNHKTCNNVFYIKPCELVQWSIICECGRTLLWKTRTSLYYLQGLQCYETVFQKHQTRALQLHKLCYVLMLNITVYHYSRCVPVSSTSQKYYFELWADGWLM
jgi:hypothetical protein